MEPQIIVPSHKRAGKVITHHAVSGCKICIPESQKNDYLKFHSPSEIITHPDNIIGLFPKRQWILEQFPDVFMLDDDITEMRYMYTEKG